MADTSPSLDAFRDLVADAVTATPGLADVFADLSTRASIQTTVETGQETLLEELAFIDPSLFREFDLFAVELGVQPPWYADETLPPTPDPLAYLDGEGRLDEEAWSRALGEFLEEVRAELDRRGLAPGARARVVAELRHYLERRARRLAEPFMREVVAVLENEWRLTSAEVEAAVRALDGA